MTEAKGLLSDERLEELRHNYARNSFGGKWAPEVASALSELQSRRSAPSRDGRDAGLEEAAKIVDSFNAEGCALAATSVTLMLVAQEIRAALAGEPSRSKKEEDGVIQGLALESVQNKEDDWQDIMTAPRDGSAFLVVRHGKEIIPSYAVVYYDAPSKQHPDHIWHFVDGGKGEAYHRNWPTHWRPLPAAPGSAPKPDAGGSMNPSSPSPSTREEMGTLSPMLAAKREAESYVANADCCSPELVNLAEQFLEIFDTFDANVDRLKACEHIADGDEGWENLRNECPSTAAVARLRDLLGSTREEIVEECAKVAEGKFANDAFEYRSAGNEIVEAIRALAKKPETT